MQYARIEDELLILCASTQFSARKLERLQLICNQTVDWDRFLHLSHKNRVVSLVYSNIKRINPDNIPPSTLAQFKDYFMERAKWNLLLKSELLCILRGFNHQGIDAISLKGVVLAEKIYGNLFLRECGDIDILVRKEQLSGAVEELVALGYSVVEDSPETSLKSGYHLHFENSNKIPHVELHWNLADNRYPDYRKPDFLWNSAQVTAYDDTQSLEAKREDLLLYLCLHGFKHQWRQLRWLCDIAELVRQSPELDWEYILHQADSLHLSKVLHLSFFLLDAFFDVETSIPIPSLAKPSKTDQKILEQVSKIIFSPEVTNATAIEVLSVTLPKVGSQRDFVSYAFRFSQRWIRRQLTPNEKDHEWVYLPEGFHWFYYPVRFIRLALWYPLATLRARLQHLYDRIRIRNK